MSNAQLKKMRSIQSQPWVRQGISLLEVIFATGVLLIGLLGLAAVLPIATNNANQSIRNDRSKEAFLNQSNLREVLGLDDLSTTNAYFVGENSRLRYEEMRDEYQQWKNEYAQYLVDHAAWVIEHAQWRIEHAKWQQLKAIWDADTNPDKGPPPQGPPQEPVEPQPPPEKPRPVHFPVRDASSLPDVFCIDPWFLTASNTLRPFTRRQPGDQLETSTVNYYDRTVFPCYDDHYPVSMSPSAAMPSLNQIPNGHWSIGIGNNLRRIPRIGVSDIVSAGFNSTITRDRDTISQVMNPDDQGAFPGLFLKRSPSLRRTSSTINGRYSFLVTARKNGSGNVIVFQDRQVVIDDTTDNYIARHNLEPYKSRATGGPNVPLSERNYAEERVGYVTYVDKIFRGNGGAFTFQMSKYCDPSIEAGDWVMLLRRNYSKANVPRPLTQDFDPAPVPTQLNFLWCQIASVDQEPKVKGEVYETTVTVRDVNWLFHPIQDFHQGLGSGPYFGTYDHPDQPPPIGWDNRTYDAAKVSGDNNWGNTGYGGDVLYGTSVVLMRNIVSVQDF